MSQTGDIERLIAPTVEQMGYRLVRVRFITKPRRTLQVMAERGDGDSVTVDDCAKLSRALSSLLDVEDPIGGAYDLEVSSTGIDRPLVRLEDFVRFEGFEANLEIDPPLEGRRRFRGRLAGVEDDGVYIELKDGSTALLAHHTITDAKLALTDELIAAMAPDHDSVAAMKEED